MGETTLYRWARKITFNEFEGRLIVPLDHTWVTDYPNPGPPNGFAQPIPTNKHYWFCWGTFHSGNDQNQNPAPYTQFLGPIHPVNLAEAECICKANIQTDPKNISWSHAHLGRIYGQHGVCHQAANRILWSAGIQSNGERATVEGVQGWQLSWFMYGPYGYKLTPNKWPLPHCEGPKKRPLTDAEWEHAIDPSLSGMIHRTLGGSFDVGKKIALQELRTNLVGKKEALDSLVENDKVGGVQFAHEVNALAADALREAASTVLRGEDFKRFFGFQYLSGAIPLIVDPEMARVYSAPLANWVTA